MARIVFEFEIKDFEERQISFCYILRLAVAVSLRYIQSTRYRQVRVRQATLPPGRRPALPRRYAIEREFRMHTQTKRSKFTHIFLQFHSVTYADIPMHCHSLIFSIRASCPPVLFCISCPKTSTIPHITPLFTPSGYVIPFFFTKKNLFLSILVNSKHSLVSRLASH